jgi:hypothetical protein
MELDELKNKWQQVNEHTTTNRFDIKNIFNRNRNNSPLALLKRNFRKRIIALMLVFVLFLQTFRENELFHNVFFLWYLVVAVILSIFFFINYRLVQDIENADSTLKDHIKTQVISLEKRIRWYRIFTRIAMIVFVILLETVPLFSNERMVQKWHSLPIVVRISSYAALLAFQHFAGKFLARKRYGQHLERMKQILSATDE